MSITEHAESAKEEAISKGIDSWPAFVWAIFYKFGYGAGAVMALVGVVGFFAWLAWGQMIQRATEASASQQALIEYVKASASEKSEVIRVVTELQISTNDSNEKLADAVTGLTQEIRAGRGSR